MARRVKRGVGEGARTYEVRVYTRVPLCDAPVTASPPLPASSHTNVRIGTSVRPVLLVYQLVTLRARQRLYAATRPSTPAAAAANAAASLLVPGLRLPPFRLPPPPTRLRLR